MVGGCRYIFDFEGLPTVCEIQCGTPASIQIDLKRSCYLAGIFKAQGGQFIKPLPRNGLSLIKMVGEIPPHCRSASSYIMAQPYGHIQEFLAVAR